MPLLLPPSPHLPPATLTYLTAYHSLLSRVRSSPHRSAGSLVIFAGVDLDALLATRVLVALFKQDDVPHTVVPVAGYEELERRREQYFGRVEVGEDGEERRVGGSSDLQTLLLLSLGSLLPLPTYFPLPPPTPNSSIHIHLIDAHRPYNLSNLFSAEVNDGLGAGGGRGRGGRDAAGGEGNRIWVWGDGGESRLEGVRKSWEALEYEPPSDSDDSSNSGSDDDDDLSSVGSDEDGSSASGSGSGSGSEEDEVEAAQNGEEDAEGDAGVDGEGGHVNGNVGTSTNGNGNGNGHARLKRKRAGKERGEEGGQEGRRRKKRREGEGGEGEGGEDQDRPHRLPRPIRQAHTARVQKYYTSGTSFGLSCVESCYVLAGEMGRGESELLWYAILGLTHQYITSRIDREEYDLRHSLYLDEVARLHPPQAVSAGVGATRANPDADDNTITPSEELRFVLFRFWNLYDAMLHSGYVAGRMGVWRDKGRKRLVGLLAKMGFSIQQCQQSYSHMDMDLKSSLRHKLDSIAPEYGLIELTYPSFTRAYGFRCPLLSAADAVEGLQALLEAATGVRVEVESEGGKGGGEWFGGVRAWRVGDGEAGEETGREEKDGEGEEGEGEVAVGGREQRRNERNFWVAYDAVKEISLLRKSLSLAKSLHTSIIRQGCSILDKNSIRTLRAFRFVAIKEGPDLRLFCHSSTLARLALWLVDATRDRVTRMKNGKRAGEEPPFPMVVACLNEEKGTYMVVGVTGAPEFGDVRKNRFGLAFQAAAEDSGAGTKHDMFDTSIVEIDKDDLTGFVESLHLAS